jgi:hypothetical protein
MTRDEFWKSLQDVIDRNSEPKPQIQELPLEDVFDMGLTGIDKTFLEQFGIRVRENG